MKKKWEMNKKKGNHLKSYYKKLWENKWNWSRSKRNSKNIYKNILGPRCLRGSASNREYRGSLLRENGKKWKSIYSKSKNCGKLSYSSIDKPSSKSKEK